MTDDRAVARYPAGQHEDQAAQRIDLLLVLIVQQPYAEAFLEFLDWRARIGHDAAVGTLDELRRCRIVVLVLDFADDLLDQILDGDETVDAAELVDDHGHVNAREPHLLEQV